MSIKTQTQSLYKQISDFIANDIESGNIKSGEKLPSTKELAETHGTSVLTVRQAIKDLTLQGLVKTVHGVGTFVMNQQKKVDYVEKVMQLVICSVHKEGETDPFANSIVYNLCYYATIKGFSMNVVILPRHKSINEYLANGFNQNMYNGLIIVLNNQVLDTDIFNKIVVEAIPLAIIPIKKLDGLPQVRSDGKAAAKRTIQRLTSYSHKKGLFILPENELAFCVNYCNNLGLSLSSEYFHLATPWNKEPSRQIVSKAIENNLEFSSIYVSGDMGLLGAYEALTEHGLKVPEDVSLVCHDKYDLMDTLLPIKISGQQQNLQGIAQVLLDFLAEQRLAGKTIIRDILIPMDAIEGNSVRYLS